MEVKITYRGWPGHFICASRCLFRLNTLVEYGEKRIVVSTVGQYSRDGNYSKCDSVGVDRYYETMVFWAEKTGEFWDADVSNQITNFESKWYWSKLEDELKANKGHMKVVEEIANKLRRNEL